MLSIIIPQYNMAKMTEECINSIIENTNYDYEIILVDNGSSDLVSDEVRNKVKYIKISQNVFFSGGCNLGANSANGEDLCFLNNDILAKKGWLEPLLELLHNKEVGIVAPKLLYPTGSIQHAGVEVTGGTRDGDIFNHRYRHCSKDDKNANTLREYQSITGAAFVIKKNDFISVDRFDEGYINGYEDNDLCFKVRFDLGLKVLYCPSSELIHRESATPRGSGNTARGKEGQYRFFDKWGSKLKIDKPIWDEIDRMAK